MAGLEPAVALNIAAGLLGSLPTTVSNLNLLRHSVVNFRRHVQSLRLMVEACEAEFLAWNKTWNYNNYSPDVYRFLWGQLYNRIINARAAVDEDVQRLWGHIEHVLDTPTIDREWTRHFAFHRRPILRRLTFALCSEKSLIREITQLNDDLKNLQTLSDVRLKLLSGTKLSTPITAPLATRLGNLVNFGQNLFLNLRQPREASDWALELRPLETSGDAEAWQSMRFLRVSFMFFLHSPQNRGWHRVTLQYMLQEPIRRDDGESWVVDSSGDANPQSNSTVSRDRLYMQRTRPFRTLFKEGIFGNRAVYKAWEADQAHLVLSLSNWAMLFCKSDWATNICCCRIRFVRVGTEAEAMGARGPRLHSLAIQESHEHQEQHGRQVQQAGNEECFYRSPGLKNLGLVLAETICATPFRQPATNTSQYERWNGSAWVEISETDLLDIVRSKSNSEKLVKAIEFCLNVDVTANADDIASFYSEYVEQVLTP